MRDLLLNPNLIKSRPGDEIHQVARVQTLTTLRSLDADRNERVLRFLKEAYLMGTQGAIISLSNANLSNDDLSGADLSGIDLTGASLTGAHLNGADLSNTTLYGANLGNADLSHANLSGAFLFDATLTGADLNDAKLGNATLTGTFLGGTSMNRTTLTGARLNGAVLTGANLNDAYLSGADLNGADLTNTALSGADFSDADLIAAGLTQPQLDAVNSCTNAMLQSTGLICRRSITITGDYRYTESRLIGPTSTPSITLTYWYTESPTEEPVINNLISKFEQNNPGIKIIAKRMPFLQTETRFINAAQEGGAPDVLRSAVGWVAQFASQDYLLNLDSHISQSDRSDYLGAPLSYDYYRGHYYGLPQVTDFLALLYNKADLATPPATMADLEADAVKIAQRNPRTYGFETNGGAYDVLPFLYAFGGGMLDPHNKPIVASDGSVNGLKFLLQLQNTDKVMPANVNFSLGPVTPTVNDFITGRAAMIFGGPYNVSQILADSRFKHSNLGIARIPACPVGAPLAVTCHAGQTGSPLGGQSYVIFAGTAHPIEAYKFIKFMNSTDSQIAIAKANNTLPTRWSAYQKIPNERFISEFCNIRQPVVALPAIPQAGHLFDAFDPNIAAALDGQSPRSALTAVAGTWKQLLAGS